MTVGHDSLTLMIDMELPTYHFCVESFCLDVNIRLGEVLAISCFARRESLVHQSAPDDEPESNQNCRRKQESAAY